MTATAFALRTWLVILSACSFDAGTAAPGRAYHLDKSGNDTRDGSIHAPFKTLARLNRIKFKAGDSIIFAGGQNFNGTLIISNCTDATAEHPIVIGSDSLHNATIFAGRETAVMIQNSNHIKIHNLILTGLGPKNGNIKSGVFVSGSHHVQVLNLLVSGFQKGGVKIYNSSFVSVQKVRANDNGFAGIYITGPYKQKTTHHITVSNCIASGNLGDPTELENHSGNGILAGYCRNILIEHCRAYNNGWEMPRKGNGPIGIWCYEADSVTIQYCLSYDNGTSKGGEDGGGFDFDGGTTNSVMQYCVSKGNAGSGFGIFQYAGAGEWRNNIIRYNLSYRDGLISAAQAGVYVWSSSSRTDDFNNLSFYGNIVVSPEGSAIHFAKSSNANGFAFFNNLFVAGRGSIKGESKNALFVKNCWLNADEFKTIMAD